VLWSAFGTGVAFSYSAVLFFLGALVVARVNRPRPGSAQARGAT
jgi:hypothetical protein